MRHDDIHLVRRTSMQPETLTIQCELREIERACAFAARFCETRAVGHGQARSLVLILEELVTNTVKHGKCAPGSAISVTLERTPAGIEIGYRDHGVPFDPNKDVPAPNFARTLTRRPPGGLGWHLIKFYCSRLDYRRDHDTNLLALSVPISRDGVAPR